MGRRGEGMKEEEKGEGRTHQYGHSYSHEILWLTDAGTFELDFGAGGFVDAQVAGSRGEFPWWLIACCSPCAIIYLLVY